MEDIKEMLVRIDANLRNHIERYDRDRAEISVRVAEDKKEQNTFREGIIEKVENLEEKIDPVVSDHKTIMRVIKWTGAGGTVTFLAFLWNYAKEHLK